MVIFLTAGFHDLSALCPSTQSVFAVCHGDGKEQNNRISYGCDYCVSCKMRVLELQVVSQEKDVGKLTKSASCKSNFFSTQNFQSVIQSCNSRLTTCIIACPISYMELLSLPFTVEFMVINYCCATQFRGLSVHFCLSLRLA